MLQHLQHLGLASGRLLLLYTSCVEIIKAGTQQLTICPHCNATSLCQFTTVVWWEELSDNEALRFYALRCSKCGTGVEKETKNELVAPVCSICYGRGYLLIT